MIALHFICCFSFFLFPGTWEADTGRASGTQESQGQKGDCDAMRGGGIYRRDREAIAGGIWLATKQMLAKHIGKLHLNSTINLNRCSDYKIMEFWWSESSFSLGGTHSP